MPQDDQGLESDDDVRLLAELSAAVSREQQPPPGVIAAARAAFGLRDLDVELALLTWDSELDAPLAAVRGPIDVHQARALTFELDGLIVEIEIVPVPSGRSLVGQLVPPQPARVRVLTPSGDLAALDVDELGGFTGESLPPGLLRLRVERPDRQPVVTSWVRLD